MFNLDIIPNGVYADSNAINVNGINVANVTDRVANLWRVINDADQVFVSDDMALMTEREPQVLVRFRLTQPEMEAFLKAVMFTYDANTEGPMHLGWDEIDPTLRRMFHRDAEDIVESDCWEVDQAGCYPTGQPIIIIHPEKIGGLDETAFIELYYVVLEPAP